jgi:hypothetical protein
MPRAPISKKQNPLPPLDWWLIVLYVIWLLVGTSLGIWVNDRFYARERGEMNAPNSSHDGQDDLP